MTAPLLARLGYQEDEVVVIVSCDELGFCHAANVATYELLRAGRATSSSLMVPAPWARSAAASYQGDDVGVHLTLISELDRYRWGPITQAPSLLDGDGAFPRTVDDLWEHADLDEVRRELRAQIERAVLWGIGVTHLVTHVDTTLGRPEFFDVFLDLAEDFHLPIRLIGADEERSVGFPLRELVAQREVVTPDSVISLSQLGDDAEAVVHAIAEFAPGVHEIICRVALETDELRNATPQWEERTQANALLRAMNWEQMKITLTNYRAMAGLMRKDATH